MSKKQLPGVVAPDATRELVEATEALANKVDATSECDHKRYACEEVGCIGAEVKRARAALQRVREGR